ncbi:MAG TPA: hypothetical protein VJK48_04140 [Chlamydiales bacterium]|nr:hypothetical protein [Chlamydiales bacterium]
MPITLTLQDRTHIQTLGDIKLEELQFDNTHKDSLSVISYTFTNTREFMTTIENYRHYHPHEVTKIENYFSSHVRGGAVVNISLKEASKTLSEGRESDLKYTLRVDVVIRTDQIARLVLTMNGFDDETRGPVKHLLKTVNGLLRLSGDSVLSESGPRTVAEAATAAIISTEKRAGLG